VGKPILTTCRPRLEPQYFVIFRRRSLNNQHRELFFWRDPM
jgi:hypothetical protein